MSSPPGSATSPPPYGNSSLSLPRKRPSQLAPPGVPSAAKRRKPSSISSATHPLRQTSFPPPEGYQNAPFQSRDSSFSPAVEGSVSSFGARATGKKKQLKNARSVTASVTGTSKPGAPSATGDARFKDAEGNDAGREDEDGEEDDDDDLAGLLDGEQMDDAQRKQESEHKAMLVQALSPEQWHRYETWRRVKLKKETVRRITNQTLSQSVAPSIITTVNGYTKIFIGELVELARDVQTEWIAASLANVARHNKKATRSDGTVTTDDETMVQPRLIVDERDKGPLTPSHLREALRRYKKDREGGSAGFTGLSMQGRGTVASRAGGKRLFR